MIKLVPSISVYKGKVIRLTRGDYKDEKEYSESPVDIARKFEDIGVEVIHLIDLEGAEKESPKAFPVLETIAGHTNLDIEYAGGIRTYGDINKVFEYGGTYVSAGSVGVEDHETFASWLITYGREKISLSADAIEGKIAISGWQRKTDIDLFDHIEYFYSRGLKYVKVTDINRDGVMEGPNFDWYKELVEKFPDACIIASGGVRSVDDIKKLENLGLYAVVFGKAFYEGKLKLEDLKHFIN